MKIFTVIPETVCRNCADKKSNFMDQIALVL